MELLGMEMPEIIPNFHPLFVHFTVALLSIATLLFLAGKITGKETLTKAAHINLWLGAFITVGTVLAGWDAYNTVAHDGPSHAAMTDHKNWALPTAGAFMVLALWSAATYRKTVQASTLFLVLMIVASGSLAVTGFKGGEAVYRYGLGVMSMPQIAGDGGHGSHDHGDGAGHGDGHGAAVMTEEAHDNTDNHHAEQPSETNDSHDDHDHGAVQEKNSVHDDEHDHGIAIESSWLKPVEAKYVCMVNNKVFDKAQIPVEVDGKTYYGCCSMCKKKLQISSELRNAKDPVSGHEVNKSSAVIGADSDGKVYYFENVENMRIFKKGDTPKKHAH